MIAIVDYGVGNLKNVQTAFNKIEVDSIITSNTQNIDDSDAIVLPGVGAFHDAIECLDSRNLITCLEKNVKKGKPLLGICLGAQLLFDKSYENGVYNGLGFIKGEVVKFQGDLKVPHMGWNTLHKNTCHKLIEKIQDGEYAYFVHSYYIKPNDFNDVLLYTDYGIRVPAIVAKDNVYGFQFHPEKSSFTGKKLLLNFKELIK